MKNDLQESSIKLLHIKSQYGKINMIRRTCIGVIAGSALILVAGYVGSISNPNAAMYVIGIASAYSVSRSFSTLLEYNNEKKNLYREKEILEKIVCQKRLAFYNIKN